MLNNTTKSPTKVKLKVSRRIYNSPLPKSYAPQDLSFWHKFKNKKMINTNKEVG